MPVLEARTVVHCPAEIVFDALTDLRRYEGYSAYLTAIERRGDGGVDTEYTFRFEWWPVTYAVRARITRIERPDRIDFEVTKGLAAEGTWFIEPVEREANHHGDDDEQEPAVAVRFVVDYDPDSVPRSTLRLPAIGSLEKVIDRVTPLVEREVGRVVERAVRELEGSERDVTLEIVGRRCRGRRESNPE